MTRDLFNHQGSIRQNWFKTTVENLVTDNLTSRKRVHFGGCWAEKRADIWWRYHWFFRQMTSEKWAQKIPYWWRVTTQIWVVLLIGRAAWEIWFNKVFYGDPPPLGPRDFGGSTLHHRLQGSATWLVINVTNNRPLYRHGDHVDWI